MQQSFANPTKKYKKCSRRSIYQISKMGKTVFCWKKHDTNNQWHYQRHWKNCIRKNKVWEKIIVDVEFVDIYLKRWFSLESHHHLIRSIMYCTFFLDSGLCYFTREKTTYILPVYFFYTRKSIGLSPFICQQRLHNTLLLKSQDMKKGVFSHTGSGSMAKIPEKGACMVEKARLNKCHD